jgi:hypothetical protein
MYPITGIAVCCARTVSGHTAAEQRYELAPFQLTELHALPLTGGAMAA